jgi:hypothetical protein
MHDRSSPFRLFVTLLLTVAVPFCCCDFHSWLSVCEPCDAATHQAAVEPLIHDHAAGFVHDHESDHHADRGTASTDGNQSTVLTVAKTTLEFPTPILVAILSFPTILESGALSPFRTGGRDLWVDSRPPTTLLRLHCALIV